MHLHACADQVKAAAIAEHTCLPQPIGGGRDNMAVTVLALASASSSAVNGLLPSLPAFCRAIISCFGSDVNVALKQPLQTVVRRLENRNHPANQRVFSIMPWPNGS